MSFKTICVGDRFALGMQPYGSVFLKTIVTLRGFSDWYKVIYWEDSYVKSDHLKRKHCEENLFTFIERLNNKLITMPAR